MRANRPIAGDTRRNRWRSSQRATSGHRVALNSFAAPSLSAVRGFFRRNRFVCDFVVRAYSQARAKRRFDWVIFYLVRDFSYRNRIFPRTRCDTGRSLHARPVLFVLSYRDWSWVCCRGKNATDVSEEYFGEIRIRTAHGAPTLK